MTKTTENTVYEDISGGNAALITQFLTLPAFAQAVNDDAPLEPAINIKLRVRPTGAGPEDIVEHSFVIDPLDAPILMGSLMRTMAGFFRDDMSYFARINGQGEKYEAFLQKLDDKLEAVLSDEYESIAEAGVVVTPDDRSNED